MLITDIPN